MAMKTLFIFPILVATLVAVLAGCTPTVQVVAPKEPIEINLNIKIQHEIRIQVDKDLEGLFEEDSELF
jgi:hypothetical protein